MDYYKILEVEKTATQDEIKRAYRRLARKYYPDLNPNNVAAEYKFGEVVQAMEVLGNPAARANYDQYGSPESQETAENEKNNTRNRYERDIASTFGGFTDANFEGAEIFNDLFKDMFGETENQQVTPVPKTPKKSVYLKSYQKFKGKDIHEEISITLREVAVSQQKVIFVNGKNIRFNVPAGIANGYKMRLKGYGSPGFNGGPNGDLCLTFNILPDTTFERIGNDLKVKVQIDLFTMVLGGQVLIDTISGKIKLTVPPESQNAATIRLKGKGLPVFRKNGEFGDLLITYEVQLPKNLTEEQKNIFRELKNSH